LEKDRAILTEKVGTIEGKLAESEEKYGVDTARLAAELKELKDNEASGATVLQAEIEKYKTLHTELSKELAEKNSSYERDKTLWENKFNFLVQQRD
jgi:hypothetical protein